MKRIDVAIILTRYVPDEASSVLELERAADAAKGLVEGLRKERPTFLIATVGTAQVVEIPGATP